MPYIDYFVGDTYTLTDNNRKQFSERLITLPIFYQPPDSSRTLAESSDRTSHLDVAEDSIVLGAFNSIYKLTPEIYDIWLKLLSKHPKCILWLTETSASGKSRLLKLASMAGIEPSRIIFAPFLFALSIFGPSSFGPSIFAPKNLTPKNITHKNIRQK